MSNKELARRAVASKHWRWKKGCVSTCGGICTGDEDDEGWLDFLAARSPTPESGPTPHCRSKKGLLPDLDDPATLGCLLALVREAWGRPDLYVSKFRNSQWLVDLGYQSKRGYLTASGASEAAALVAALEAAP